ncbi:MAG: DUF418 domain-containing protein [Cytophagaceae bacterium]
MSDKQITPLSEKERLHILDALRGFALLGIYFVNLNYFSGYKYFSGDAVKAYSYTANSDEYFNFLIQIFAEGKFYSLFSFLFGLGFAVQMHRTIEKGKPFLKLYFRRLLILLFIGLIHTYLIWPGDILTIYAIAAVLLIPFRNASDKSIITAAVLLIVSPVLFYAFMMFTGIILGEPFVLWANELMHQWGIPSQAEIFRSGDFRTFILSKLPVALLRYSDLFFSSRFPKLWGMFLLGFYFGRNKIFSNPEMHKGLFKKILVYAGIFGLVFSVITGFYNKFFVTFPVTITGLYSTILQVFAVHPLAMAYMAGFTLLYLKIKNQNFLNLLAPAGRMALTNYMLQSIIGILFFYHIGLGLGPVGPTIYVPFALIVFTLQVLFSHWWLSKYKFGPLEWLWRSGIYGKFQEIRKT